MHAELHHYKYPMDIKHIFNNIKIYTIYKIIIIIIIIIDR